MKALFVSSALTLFASTAWACTDESGLALTALDDGAPVAYVTDLIPPVSAPFDLELTLCSGIAANVSFDAIMPAHQHGMNYTVEARQVGRSVFELPDVVFHMPGLWELQFSVTLGEAEYRYRGEMIVP